MTGIRTGTLVVPGAALHYKLRGSGPALLIIRAAGETPTPTTASAKSSPSATRC